MFTYLQHSDPTVPYYRDVGRFWGAYYNFQGTFIQTEFFIYSVNGRSLAVHWPQSIDPYSDGSVVSSGMG